MCSTIATPTAGEMHPEHAFTAHRETRHRETKHTNLQFVYARMTGGPRETLGNARPTVPRIRGVTAISHRKKTESKGAQKREEALRPEPRCCPRIRRRSTVALPGHRTGALQVRTGHVWTDAARRLLHRACTRASWPFVLCFSGSFPAASLYQGQRERE